MAGRVIEAEARIRGTDLTGGMFDSVRSKIAALQKIQQIHAKGHVQAAAKAEKAIASLNQRAGAIEGFRTQHAALQAARVAFRQAEADVQRLGRAMRESANPTREMSRQYEQAQRSVRAAANAFADKRLAVNAARQEMGRYGVTLQNVSREQRSVDRALNRRQERRAAAPAHAPARGGGAPPAGGAQPAQGGFTPRAAGGRAEGEQKGSSGVGETIAALPIIQQGVAALRAGVDVDSERARMRSAGWSEQDIKTAEHRGNRFAAQYGVSPASSMGIIREARPIFGGDMKQTIASVPDFFAVRTAMQQGSPKATDEELDRAMGQVIKAAEIGGYSKEPEKLKQFAHFMAQMSQTHGSALRGEEVVNFFKSGKTAASAADFEFLKSIMPTLLPEQGGDRLGTALMTLRQALVGGKMKHLAAKNLAELGLIDESKIERDEVGDVKGVKRGGLKGQELAEKNPLEWIKQHLLPAMDAKGVKPEERDAKVSSLFSDRNAEYVVSQMMNNLTRLEKDRAVVEQAKGLPGAEQALRDDPKLVAARVTAAASNAGAAVVDPIMESLKGLGVAVAERVNEAAEKARENPNVSKAGAVAAGIAGGVGAGYLAQGAGWLGRGAMIVGGGVGGAIAGGLSLPYLISEALQSDPHLKARAEQHIKIGPEVFERALADRRRRERDPEGARGEAMRKVHGVEPPKTAPSPGPAAAAPLSSAPARVEVDTTAVDAARTKAADAGQTMQSALNVTTRPKVDDSEIVKLIAQINAASAALDALGGKAATAGSRVKQAIRSSYSDMGISE